MIPINYDLEKEVNEVAQTTQNSVQENPNQINTNQNSVPQTETEPVKWPEDVAIQSRWRNTRRRVTLYLPHAWSALLRQVAYAKEQSLVAWAQEHVIEDAKALGLELPSEENRTTPLPLA